MRMTKLFYEALREDPADATIISHKLLTRGCFIRSLATGIFSYLPLGYRVKRKIEAIFREEMEAIGVSRSRCRSCSPPRSGSAAAAGT